MAGIQNDRQTKFCIDVAITDFTIVVTVNNKNRNSNLNRCSILEFGI